MVCGDIMNKLDMKKILTYLLLQYRYAADFSSADIAVEMIKRLEENWKEGDVLRWK